MIETILSGSETDSPLYQEVRNRVLQCLIDKEWSPGEAIPSEAKLAQRFHVSIGTVRKAINDLVLENILIRHQGRGTFVATHNKKRNIYYFFNIVNDDGHKEPPQGKLISLSKMRADEATRLQLKLGRNATIYQLWHVHYLDDRPVAVNDIRLPVALFPRLTAERFENRGDATIYGFYQGHYSVNVVRTVEKVKAVPATAEVAKLLGIASGTAVLRIDRLAYSLDTSPVEFRRSYANTEHYHYLNDSSSR